MRKTAKKWTIAAVALVGVSAVAFAGAVVSVGGDLKKFELTKYQAKAYAVAEDFDKISIKTSVKMDIVFALSSDGACRVDAWEAERVKYDVSVRGGVLEIDGDNNRFLHERLFDFSKSKTVTVYLPKTEYDTLTFGGDTSDINLPNDFTFGSLDITTDTGDVACAATVLDSVKIVTDTGDIEFNSISSVETAVFKTGTGDISVKNLSVGGALSFEMDTGDLYASDLRCGSVSFKMDTGDITIKNTSVAGNFTLESDTGDVDMQNVISGGEISLNTDTGDVKFENCDGETLSIQTHTGDIKGSLLTEKVFIAYSKAGKVEVPETVTGGKCSLKSNTGDIVITLVSA